jgi:ABC-type sugar transport system ATPase subunit
VVKLEEVTISHLTKNFGELIAVNDMSLEVPAGSIFGLLGPNGAGKSTTTRILSTLLKPTSGTAVVAGHDIHEEPVKIREITGVLPEEANHTIYEAMSAYENLEYFAKLYGMAEEAIGPAIQELPCVEHCCTNPRSSFWMNQQQHWIQLHQREYVSSFLVCQESTNRHSSSTRTIFQKYSECVIGSQ